MIWDATKKLFEGAWKLPSYLFVRFKDKVYHRKVYTRFAVLYFVLLMSLFLNPLSPRIYVCNFRCANCKRHWRFDILSIQANISLTWLSEDLVDSLTLLAQAMAWCRLASNHYLSQCWSRSISLGHTDLLYLCEICAYSIQGNFTGTPETIQ